MAMAIWIFLQTDILTDNFYHDEKLVISCLSYESRVCVGFHLQVKKCTKKLGILCTGRKKENICETSFHSSLSKALSFITTSLCHLLCFIQSTSRWHLVMSSQHHHFPSNQDLWLTSITRRHTQITQKWASQRLRRCGQRCLPVPVSHLVYLKHLLIKRRLWVMLQFIVYSRSTSNR